jgi:hypothetical protein
MWKGWGGLMTQGYIFLGVDDPDKTTNIECAYALSLSIKLADPDAETCVVIHKFAHVPKRYENGFDYIVELPYGRTDVNHHDIMLDFWQMYYCTPFDETMFINTYSLAIDNIISLWEMRKFDSIVFGSAQDYRGGGTYDVSKFIAQARNKIPEFDTDVIYFRKDLLASEFFKMADPVFKHWRDIFRSHLPEYSLADFDFTMVINLVAQILGESYQSPEYFDYTDLSLNFLFDLETDIQTDWLNSVNIWITDNIDVKINNHRQTGIFYYSDPSFMTTEILRKLHDNYTAVTATLVE